VRLAVHAEAGRLSMAIADDAAAQTLRTFRLTGLT
jgi:hypothetical protein